MENTPNSPLDELQEAVDDLVGDSSKAQIAQCARVLATYVALYKHHFGELTREQYEELGEEMAASFEFGESVYRNGLREMLETLSLLETPEPGELANHPRGSVH